MSELGGLEVNDLLCHDKRILVSDLVQLALANKQHSLVVISMEDGKRPLGWYHLFWVNLK